MYLPPSGRVKSNDVFDPLNNAHDALDNQAQVYYFGLMSTTDTTGNTYDDATHISPFSQGQTRKDRPMTTTTQKSQPAAAFHACCGRRTQLPHKPTCSAAAPSAVLAPAPANDTATLVVKRVGTRVTWTRGRDTGVLKFRVVSVAKQAEQAIRANPAKLAEAIALQQRGLWS